MMKDLKVLGSGCKCCETNNSLLIASGACPTPSSGSSILSGACSFRHAQTSGHTQSSCNITGRRCSRDEDEDAEMISEADHVADTSKLGNDDALPSKNAGFVEGVGASDKGR